MKFRELLISLFRAGAISFVLSPVAAIAQIVPDDSLPVDSLVTPGCADCEIIGGTRSGSNLFHSFEQFSIPAGGLAHFQNASDIQTIFARVTGQSRSAIDGILRANGSADLFLLNPNGIIFGKNAALDIGGSFFATTADSINFADGFRFSATERQDLPLLTVSAPIGLQFGENSGSIINRSQASLEWRVNSLGVPVGLDVQPKRSLTLLGNGVFLENGNLTAQGGRITLGSVSPSSFVALNPVALGYGVSYSDEQAFRDIRLIDISYLDTSDVIGGQAGGGAIRLQGRDIRLTRSTVTSSNFGGTGGSVKMIASGSLLLANGSSIGSYAEGIGQAGRLVIRANRLIKLRGDNPSSLSSQALSTATGSAGEVFIRTDQLLLTDGSRIESSSFGAGQAGDIRIRVLDLRIADPSPLMLDGNEDEMTIPGEVSSGIFAQVQIRDPEAIIQSGNAGDLTIRTRRLTLSDGGVISTATFASGSGGALTIHATDSIVLRGASPAVTRDQYRSGIFVSAEPGATGKVGALEITTPQLTVADRAEISANNRGSGEPGSTLLRVDELDVHGGGEVRASALGRGQGGTLTIYADSIEVSGVGRIGAETVPSSLAALARRLGDAGDLTIETSTLDIRDGAEVSVSGQRLGSAGTLEVLAGQITLDQGQITASTENGRGAEITLSDLDLLLTGDGSQITARAANDADGGNVSITTVDGFILAFGENTDIVANAVEGRGGDITIDARSIIGLEERLSTPPNNTNDIDASSEFGTSGSVIILQPDVDPSQGIVDLPADIIDASQLVAQGCATGAISAERVPGEFVITGRGGLALSPNEPISGDTLSLDWIELPSESELQSTPPSPVLPNPSVEPSLVEAQGWMIDSDGEVLLTAHALGVMPRSPNPTLLVCAAAQREPI